MDFKNNLLKNIIKDSTNEIEDKKEKNGNNKKVWGHNKLKKKKKGIKANMRHRFAGKSNRATSRGKVQDAYADKTCEAGIKKLFPYGN